MRKAIITVGLFAVTVVAILYGTQQMELRRRGNIVQTGVNMRWVWLTLHEYQLAYKRYPAVASVREIEELIDPTLRARITKEHGKFYCPAVDGWDNALFYMTSKDSRSYVLASPGQDGKLQTDASRYLSDRSQNVLDTSGTSKDDMILNHTCEKEWPLGLVASMCR